MVKKDTTEKVTSTSSRAAEAGTGLPASSAAHQQSHDQRTAEGAQSCNTAPANCIPGNSIRVLRNDIDSLYLSYPGQLSDESHIRLERLKELAQSQSESNRSLAQYEADDFLLEVWDRGSHPYKFILRNNIFFLKVAGLTATRVPLVYAQLASEALTINGAEQIEKGLRTVVSSLGTLDGEPSVSRIDLCVDFTTTFPLGELTDRDWVSRARNIDRHSKGGAFTGFSIGRGGQMVARLYDKTLEIETISHKTYLHDFWRTQGWDGEQKVWRMEFQFRRDVLRELDLKSFSELVGARGGLWAYASTHWLRLTLPNAVDKTQSRWPPHPLWEALQAVDWDSPNHYARSPVSQMSVPGDRWIFVNGLSGITSFMAREGISNFDEGLDAFWVAARTYHDDRANLTGIDFDNYVDEKVRAKMRNFSSFRNSPRGNSIHPADHAVASEYRKRRDGE